MQIKAISHIGFNCKDLDASADFYCKILGARVKFYLTYGDVADDLRRQCAELKKPEPPYLAELQKYADKKWSVSLQLSEDSFIELFYIIGANKEYIPGRYDLNYSHYSLEVTDIRAFREKVIANGGEEFLDTDISVGLDLALQMWMHDPDGNKFEITEYTMDSMQITGR